MVGGWVSLKGAVDPHSFWSPISRRSLFNDVILVRGPSPELSQWQSTPWTSVLDFCLCDSLKEEGFGWWVQKAQLLFGWMYCSYSTVRKKITVWSKSVAHLMSARKATGRGKGEEKVYIYKACSQWPTSSKLDPHFQLSTTFQISNRLWIN